MEIKKRRFEYLWVQFTAGGPGLRGMQAIVKSGVGRGLTHLLHLPSVYASIVKFRVRFAHCGINVVALKYEYGCIVYLFL